MNNYVSPWMDEDLAIFREAAARFLEAEMVPHEAEWRKQQHVGKDIWLKAGSTGLLCTDIPADYGGVGGDFRHEAVLYEELARRGLSGFGQGVHSICAHYLVNHGTEEQKRRFLPRMASGALIGAIGMTEPAAGSDLQGLRTRAVRDGDDYVVNGSKIFITNGYLAGLIALGGQDAARHGSQGHIHHHGRNGELERISRRANSRQDGHEVAGHGGTLF
jgi:acyl-CoA dehydrogenase